MDMEYNKKKDRVQKIKRNFYKNSYNIKEYKGIETATKI